MARNRRHVQDVRLRLKTNQLTKTVSARLKGKKRTRAGAVVADSLVSIGGTLFPAGGLGASSVVEVENAGRPAAALYKIADAGGVSVGGRGGGGGGGTIESSAYLPRDGSRPMLGALDMGGYSITNVNLVDGVDVSAIGAVDSRVDFLEARTVEADGPGLTSDEVLFGVGNPTITFDPTAIAGVALTTSGSGDAEQLDVQTGYGAKITAGVVAVDPTYNFNWTGNHTHTGVISSSPFDSADPITGWKIERDGDAWFSNIEATSLTVKSFIADVTLALQGSQYITKSKAEVSRDFTVPGTTGTLYVYDLPGQPNSAVFESGDWVRLRYVERSTGLIVGDAWGTVSNYTDLDDGEQSWTFTRQSGLIGKTIFTGMVALDYGKSGDGYIELTSIGSDAPYMNVRTWVTNPSVGANHTTRSRVGNLSGITDDSMGVLSGYGIYSDLGFFNGELVAADGDVAINDYGIQLLSAGSGGSWLDTSQAVSWVTEQHDVPSWGKVSAQILGRHYDSGGTIYNALDVRAVAGSNSSGSDTGTDVAEIEIGTQYLDDTYAIVSGIKFNVSSGVATAQIDIGSTGNVGGELIFVGGASSSPMVIRPQLGSALNLGTSSRKIKEIHVETLYAGTTSSTDTGHNHNDIYYTKSESNTLLSGKANAVHTHTGYATTVDLTDGLAGKSDTGHTHDDRYYTEAEIDALVADIADAVHTHDERYYTESEVDALFTASDAALSAHTSDASIHFEIDDGASSGGNVVWSVDKLQTELAAAVPENVAYTNVDNEFSVSQTINGSLDVSADVSAGQYVKVTSGLVVGAQDTPDAMLDVRGDAKFSGGDIDILGDWTFRNSDGAFISVSYNAAETAGMLLDPSGYGRFLGIGGKNLTVEAATMMYKSVAVSGGRMLLTPGGASTLSTALYVTDDLTPPVFTWTPEPVVAGVGEDAFFYAQVYLEPWDNVTIGWQHSEDDGASWDDVSETDNSAVDGYATHDITVASGMDGLLIRAKATNSVGTVYSDAVSLSFPTGGGQPIGLLLSLTYAGESGANQPIAPDGFASTKPTQFSVVVSDNRDIGPFAQFAENDIIRVIGEYERSTPDTSDYASLDYLSVGFAALAAPADGISTYDVYFRIVEVEEREDGDESTTYICEFAQDVENLTAGTFAAGTPVLGYGNASEEAQLGYIEFDVSHPLYSPSISIYTYINPWEPTLVSVDGNTGSTSVGSRFEFGSVRGINLDDPNAQYFLATSERMRLQNIPFRVTDDDGNIVAEITPEEGFTCRLLTGVSDFEPSRFTLWDTDNNAALAYLQGEYQRDIFGEPTAGARRAQLVANHHTVVETGAIEAHLQLLAGNFTWANEGVDFENATIDLTSDWDGSEFQSDIVLSAKRITLNTERLNVYSLPSSSSGLNRWDVYVEPGTGYLKAYL